MRKNKEGLFSLGEVTVVLGEDTGDDVIQEVESFRDFAGEWIHLVGEAPKLW